MLLNTLRDPRVHAVKGSQEPLQWPHRKSHTRGLRERHAHQPLKLPTLPSDVRYARDPSRPDTLEKHGPRPRPRAMFKL